MRIVWKDSASVKTPVKCRGFNITGYRGGWITDIPGDDNIYKSNKSARNAVDKHLGLYDINNTEPVRHKLGIQVIGKISERKSG
jgi:hypothetical protein